MSQVAMSAPQGRVSDTPNIGKNLFWDDVRIGLNILLLGALTSATAVSVFAAASRFMKLGTLALVAIFYVISPQVSAFLARGGSAGPVEQLRDLGFDPARAGAWQAGLDELARLMDELAR